MVEYAAVFLAGLFGSLHCVGMCGGFVAAYSLKLHATSRPLPHLLFNAGRLSMYAVIGGVLGLFGSAFDLIGRFSGLEGLRSLLAGSLIVLLGLGRLGWLRQGNAREESRIGRAFRQVFGASLKIQGAHGAFLAGLPIGFLPCGLLLPVELMAASTGDFFRGALVMLLFGLGTSPTLVALGMASSLLKRVASLPVQRAVAGLFIAIGVTLILEGLGVGGVVSHLGGHR